MPLNINDQTESPNTDPQKPQPILRGPAVEPKSKKKMFVYIFAVVVLVAAGVIVYLFSSMNSHKQVAQSVTESQPAESNASPTGQPLAEQPSADRSSESPSGVTGTSSGTQTSSGRYTIYIASYRDRTPAEEEVSRWNEAGYKAAVVEIIGHFRVSLGEYAGFREARNTAENLNEAFENGYWIGMR